MQNLMGKSVNLLASSGVNKKEVSKHMPNLMDLLADFQAKLRNNKNFYKLIENQLLTDCFPGYLLNKAGHDINYLTGLLSPVQLWLCHSLVRSNRYSTILSQKFLRH